MKFSLQTLGWAVVFSALIVNILLTMAKSRNAIANTAKANIEIRATVGLLLGEESTLAGVSELIGPVTQLTSSKQHLLDRFDSQMDSQFKIVPVESKFSIIEKPEFQPIARLRTFLVHVPDEFDLGLMVYFEQESMSVAGKVGGFESTESALIQLPDGAVEIEFSFADADPNEPDADIRSKVRLNGEEVDSREYRADYSGFSSTNYNFDQQRNYSIGKELVELVRFQPIGTDVSIRLSIVKYIDGSDNTKFIERE